MRANLQDALVSFLDGSSNPYREGLRVPLFVGLLFVLFLLLVLYLFNRVLAFTAFTLLCNHL